MMKIVEMDKSEVQLDEKYENGREGTNVEWVKKGWKQMWKGWHEENGVNEKMMKNVERNNLSGVHEKSMGMGKGRKWSGWKRDENQCGSVMMKMEWMNK